MASKHAACATHWKLDCGCKVCAVPNVNAYKSGALYKAAELERFHRHIHRVQARHHALEKKRPAGDGLIAGPGTLRLHPKTVIARFIQPTSTNSRANYVLGHSLGANRSEVQAKPAPSLVLGDKARTKPYGPHEIPRSKFVGRRRRVKRQSIRLAPLIRKEA